MSKEFDAVLRNQALSVKRDREKESAPVGGVVLPEPNVSNADRSLAREAMRLIWDSTVDHPMEPGAKILLLEGKLENSYQVLHSRERQLTEAIAQRDEILEALREERSSKSSLACRLVAAEAELVTARRDNAQLQYALEQSETAYTIAHAQGREEGLREAARACHISTNLDAERTVLALIPKK